jgi:hypothetical protein
MLPRSRRSSLTRLRAVVAVVATVLAALALAGCGEGAAVHLDSRHVSFTLDEYRILPRTVSVPAGRIVIAVRNRGILTHNLALEREGLNASGKPTILKITPPLLPGAGVSIVTPALAPGRYVLASTIGNEAVLGMSGALVVR